MTRTLRKTDWLKLLVGGILLLTFLFPSVAWAKSYTYFTKAEKKLLVAEFLDDPDFDRDFLEKVFFKKRFKKMPVVTDRNVYNEENQRDYEDFLSRYSMNRAHRFSKKWKTVLKRASHKFEVDQEVLIAILLVETGFGNLLGKYPVISVFSSILIDGNRYIQKYGNVENPTPDQQYKLKRLNKKTAWAKEELRSFLKIIQKTPYGPFDIKGSFAGAFGIPQFLPSSYLKWGYDSDKNGSVNLFLVPDAVYSTANYLKSHGWKKGLHHEENKNVVWEYNHSRFYVDTIMEVAQRLKQKNRRLELAENEKRKKANTKVASSM